MSRYTNITNEIWRDQEFRSFQPNEKLLYLYLLTSEYSNIAGLYRLSTDDIERNVGKDALDLFIQGSKLWKYDQRTETILIPNYLKYNTAKSAPQLKAINSSVRTLPMSEVFVEWFFCLYKYSGEGALKLIDETIRKQALTLAKLMTGKEALIVSELLKDTISPY